MNKKNNIIIVILLFISLVSLYVYLKSTKRSHYFNVILITIDTLRSDHLGCYGYKRDTSPNIDKLAKEGILFTQAISQSSWTIPSISSLITSAYPHVHKFADLNVYLDPFYPDLSFLFKKEKYYTGFIRSNGLLVNLSGIFNFFDELSKNEFELKADEVTRMSTGFLKKNKNKRFFLWLHYFDPHGPYKPPAPYDRKYINDALYKQHNCIPISDIKKPGYFDKYFDPGRIPQYVAEDNITDMEYYIAQYDGEINFVDKQIGILLNVIKKLGLDKRTLIILTADHGEYLGEHNVYFSHTLLYDEVIRIPLIIKCDNMLPAGKIFDKQVGLIDIIPTIFGFLGIKTDIKMEGINLIPFILKKDLPFPREAIFSELFVGAENPSTVKAICLRTKKWKLIYHLIAKDYRMYNLESDSKELNNIAKKEKRQFIFLKTELDNWMNNMRVSQIKTAIKPLDEKTKEKLRSLGYLQ